jgi:predicted CXXCH cytochrome family protein
MKNVKLLFATSLLATASLVLAVDSPHDGTVSSSVTECQSCHRLHGGGGTLTQYAGNNEACLTCHDNIVPGANANHFFTPAWNSANTEADPGKTGSQHKWSGSPTNRGARVPLNADMAKYLPAGEQLQCAVCHDTHGKKDSFGTPNQDTLAPNSAHSSFPVGKAIPAENGGSGQMTIVSLTDPSWTALSQAYAIRIKSTSPYTFEISHDYKKTGGGFAGSYPFTTTQTPVELNNVYLDDNVVQIRFTGTPTVGQLWQFYVSFPFLRASNVADAMCTDCHADRVMDHACVEGTGAGCTPGTKVYSHPVNQALNANGKNYDAAAPLDADGTPANGSTTDGEAGVANPSNNLVLDGTVVRCTTCHAPHNADSNSLTVDVR